MINPETARQFSAIDPSELNAEIGGTPMQATAGEPRVEKSALPVSEASYLDARIKTCQQMAERSRDGCARRVHLAMADSYQARLEALSTRRPSRI